MNFFDSFRTLSPATSGQRSLDDFFNDRYRRLVSEGTINDDEMNMPPVNIERQDNTYVMEVSIPGFRKEDIEISIHENTLQISANRSRASAETPREYLRQEFRAQRFFRSFRLPENADEDHIEAKYQDGILFLTIPLLPTDKTPEVKRMIAVQ